MSNLIHGASHKALKHMRKRPATLSVYWVYISRTNNENVSWPSIRGLERDTGWNRTTCQDARAWLVEHGALERVDGYERPEWKNLDDKARAQKKNLDRAEYYRPTGYIIVDGVKYPMLYFGKDEASDIEDSDVLPRRTSTASDADGVGRGRGKTELDTCIDLDSIGEEEAPAAAETTEPNAEPDASEVEPDNIVVFPDGAIDPRPRTIEWGIGMTTPIAEFGENAVLACKHPLFKAYYDATPEPMRRAREGKIAETIAALEALKVTHIELTALVTAKWAEKGRTAYFFSWLAEDVPQSRWLASQEAKKSKPKGIWSQPAPDTSKKSDMTPEQRKAAVENAAAAKAAAMREARDQKKAG